MRLGVAPRGIREQRRPEDRCQVGLAQEAFRLGSGIITRSAVIGDPARTAQRLLVEFTD
jgi:hypothetical protein